VWRETFETNLFGAVRMCREVAPLMAKLRYGRIVNMSSGLGQLHQMGEGSPAYRVSKAALNALTRTLAAEVAGSGILVNSMSPGWVKTDMGGEDAPRSVEEGRHRGLALPAALQRPHGPILPGPQADSLVTRSGARHLLLALAALLAAACTRLAYDNATPMLTWMVDGYVDLHHEQRDWLRRRLDRAMAWHRANELPAYRRYLEDLAARVDRPFTEAEVERAYLDLRADYDRVVEHVLPDAAELFVGLDERQIAHLERKFERDREKLAKDLTDGTEARRRARAVKHTVGEVEEWTGALDERQRAIVAAREAVLPDVAQERLADRAYRQGETLVLIRTRDRARIVAGLRRLLVDTDSWRAPGYRAKILRRNAATFRMLAALSATLTPEQRAHVKRRIEGYVDDIGKLAG